MKKKIVISLVFILFLLLAELTVLASQELTLKALTDKETYSVGDKITFTVDWNEGMQAAGFTLEYDESKLKLESAEINDTFYNSDTEGLIKVNWASMEEVDYSKMTFVFKAISEGTATISITEAKAFADENLVSPSSYNINTFGTKQITIKAVEPTDDEEINKEPDKEPEKKPLDKENVMKDETTSKEKLPQTGMNTFVIFTTILIFVFGVVGFIKYKGLSEI